MKFEDSLTLESLDSGGALELFHGGLARALANIQDPNTGATVTRKIVLTVEIKPNVQRSQGALKYSVKETLAPASPQETSIIMGMQDGVAMAAEWRGDPRQMTIEETIASQGANVVPMKKEGGANA